MITETLLSTRSQTVATDISDSALKVVFLTTLYVDVKEPAVHYILDTKKTQSHADKTYSLPAITGFRLRCRDKIEPNLQSQNVRRTHSNVVESRFQRDNQNTTLQRNVNTHLKVFAMPEKPILFGWSSGNVQIEAVILDVGYEKTFAEEFRSEHLVHR